LACIYERRAKFFPIGATNSKESPAEESLINWFDINELIAVGFVYFNMASVDFLEYTPFEFNRLLEIKELQERRGFRQDMERMRIQTMSLINIQLAKKDRIKKLSDFMPFEWDIVDKQDAEAAEMTEEDWQALDNNFPGNKLKE
jgi:hypothetical protein